MQTAAQLLIVFLKDLKEEAMGKSGETPLRWSRKCKVPEAGLTVVLKGELGGQCCWNVGDTVREAMGSGGLYKAYILAFLNH